MHVLEYSSNDKRMFWKSECQREGEKSGIPRVETARPGIRARKKDHGRPDCMGKDWLVEMTSSLN